MTTTDERFQLDNGDSLLLSETVSLNGCHYELTHIGETRVTFSHIEPIDNHCSDHCRQIRTLTNEEAAKIKV